MVAPYLTAQIATVNQEEVATDWMTNLSEQPRIFARWSPLRPHPQISHEQAVALADKIDTLVGIFWKDKRPKGDKIPLH